MPVQTEVLPEIEPGVAGAVRTTSEVTTGELVPQALVALTVTVPDVVPMAARIEFVPVPLATEEPVGKVQL